MDPTTVNGTTFTVTGPGTTAVAGTVTLVGNIALFAPTANLAPSTLFTATIASGANGVKDLFGNQLAAGPVPNPWTFTTGTTPNTTPPMITLTNPANGATQVQLSATVNATFNGAMDPTTINTTTFTLAGPGTTAVAGTVTYNPALNIATFTPTSPLLATTTYTANVSNGAKDLSGNALAAGPVPNPWTFMTGPPFMGSPPPIILGTASTFGMDGNSAGMTNQGLLTQVNNGNIGTTAVSSSVTGFHDTTLPGNVCSYTETAANMGQVNGTIYTGPPPPSAACPAEGTAATQAIAQQAFVDMQAAYNQMSALPAGPNPGGGQLGGLTLTPGVYTGTTFLITTGDLTLDGQGDPNAEWVFQMGASLTVGAAGTPRNVILINGAQAKNVFWRVAFSATINPGGGGTMVGTIISNGAITVSTAGAATVTTINGRLLSMFSSVTVANTVVNVP
jgi:hypothetical protein